MTTENFLPLSLITDRGCTHSCAAVGGLRASDHSEGCLPPLAPGKPVLVASPAEHQGVETWTRSVYSTIRCTVHAADRLRLRPLESCQRHPPQTAAPERIRTGLSLYAAHWLSNSVGSVVRFASDEVYKLFVGHGDNIAHDLRHSVDAIAPQVALAVLEPEDAGGGVAPRAGKATALRACPPSPCPALGTQETRDRRASRCSVTPPPA